MRIYLPPEDTDQVFAPRISRHHNPENAAVKPYRHSKTTTTLIIAVLAAWVSLIGYGAWTIFNR